MILWMGQRHPNHQLIGGKHPTIYRVSTILLVVQDFATIHSMYKIQDPFCHITTWPTIELLPAPWFPVGLDIHLSYGQSGCALWVDEPKKTNGTYNHNGYIQYIYIYIVFTVYSHIVNSGHYQSSWSCNGINIESYWYTLCELRVAMENTPLVRGFPHWTNTSSQPSSTKTSRRVCQKFLGNKNHNWGVP